jgi:type VI secretion system protein ImpK
MSEDDPFSAFNSDRTIIKPSAGRGARPGGAPPAPAPGAMPVTAPPTATDLSELPGATGLNPLLQAAAPLLGTAARLRTQLQHPNPAALRDALAEGVRRFESDARALGLPNEQVIGGRYALCTLLDECASGTPWGGGGAWASHSLLVLFHNETWGGEKLFQLMGKLAEDVPKHRDLLELLHVVLSLGMEGRYRVLDNGRAQLENVRERLAQLLRQQRPAPDRELSPQWAGERAADARLRDGIPVWVVAAATALALLLLFAVLRLAADERSEPAFDALRTLDVKAAAPLPPPAPAAAPRLSGLLKSDIDAGLVEVRDYADRSVVVIRGDGFFEPGSAEVEDRIRPLIGRIGAALAQLDGPVLVTGHTDNQPIRSLRFPSNWSLSNERALAVRTLLAAQVKPERMRAEGRADSEPVDPANTPAARARNRRVEITLTVAP